MNIRSVNKFFRTCTTFPNYSTIYRSTDKQMMHLECDLWQNECKRGRRRGALDPSGHGTGAPRIAREVHNRRRVHTTDWLTRSILRQTLAVIHAPLYTRTHIPRGTSMCARRTAVAIHTHVDTHMWHVARARAWYSTRNRARTFLVCNPNLFFTQSDSFDLSSFALTLVENLLHV